MDAVVLKDGISGRFSDEEFFWFCQGNKDLRIERNSNLEISIMSPSTSLSGAYSGEVFRQFSNWNALGQTGLAFDSSAGFTLPDRSVFSPDVAWISLRKWNLLSQSEKDSFAPICPDFIIEVSSKTDRASNMIDKMRVWMKNGVQLAWLLDIKERQCHIYTKGAADQVVEGFDRIIDAGPPIAGFQLDLRKLELIE